MGEVVNINFVYNGQEDGIIGEQKLSYSNHNLKRLLKNLSLFGSNIKFEDDSWFCDKLIKNKSLPKSKYTVYFSKISGEYKDIVKYYAIFMLTDGLCVGTVNNNIIYINHLINFLEEMNIKIYNASRILEGEFIKYLNRFKYRDKNLSEDVKNKIFAASKKILRFIVDFKVCDINGFELVKTPYKRNNKKCEYKYIPDNIIEQLDKAFKENVGNRGLDVFYWIARSIPSRASEVLGMSLDNCLKPYGKDAYIIIIPTWKQNGGYIQEEQRLVTINYNGHGKFIVDLIKKQQEYSKSIQEKLPDDKKGFLFSVEHDMYDVRYYKKTGNHRYINRNTYGVITPTKIWQNFNSFCRRYNILNSDGSVYHLTSHQLRHNGITERHYAGFSNMEIILMTNHQNDQMIMKSYTHRKNDILLKKQRAVSNAKVESEANSDNNSAVLFKGRILNMDEATEERILKNFRAHKLKDIGICSDITKCQRKIYECLDNCDNFIPDADNLKYFEEQVVLWRKKIERFKNNKYLKENAEYNCELFVKVVEKIKNTIEKTNICEG